MLQRFLRQFVQLTVLRLNEMFNGDLELSMRMRAPTRFPILSFPRKNVTPADGKPGRESRLWGTCSD